MSAVLKMSKKTLIQQAAKDFISFVNKGPSPFHVVQECRVRLEGAGFQELKEKERWSIKPKGKYFVINNFSTVVVFAVGGSYKPGNGYSIVGAHTDSPCFRVKPRSCRTRVGYIGVGVEPYGGGIWHTWFDRDLKLAGRVILKQDGGLVHRLVHVEEPILKIPNLCIHLDRDMHYKFAPNKETHMIPVLATTLQQQLEGIPEKLPQDCLACNHPPMLISLLSKRLGCNPADIMDFELCLADAQPATIGGALEEFIFAPRIDNLMNCYTGLQGMIKSLDSLESDSNVRVLALFDNEEVGSQSVQGADSSTLEFYLRRICAGVSGTESGVAFEESIPKSIVLSADQAHAVHPNYSEKHEQNHQPQLHQGVVIKFNSNQKYATTAITASILREVARKCDQTLQEPMNPVVGASNSNGSSDPDIEVLVRNDSSCGSTIGPIISSKLGVRTVDIGTPQLSMHSIREMCCTTGVYQATALYKQFYESFPEIDAGFKAV